MHGLTYCLLQTRPLYPLQKDNTEQQHVIFPNDVYRKKMIR